jgi:hypothetical protein
MGALSGTGEKKLGRDRIAVKQQAKKIQSQE